MRIIKIDEEGNILFMSLAGEILNVESGLQHFINGEPVTLGKTIQKSEYVGYPSFTLRDGVRYNIRASCGYIYVPMGTDISEFEINLVGALNVLEANMKRLDRDAPTPYPHVQGYHTIKSSYNTNVKTQCNYEMTLYEGHMNSGAGKAGPKRVLLRDETSSTRGRFTWFIIPIDKIDFVINSSDADRAIWRFASSIFWDRDNISKCTHNDLVFTFNRSMIQGSENIVPEKITLFRHATNPLLIELNDYWKEQPLYVQTGKTTEGGSLCLRNIRVNRLFSADFTAIKIQPIKVGTGSEVSTDVCASCKGLLYDDFYALTGDINGQGDDSYSIAVCPLCMHSSPEDTPLEQKYFKIFRVKCPRSVQDMIDMAAGNDVTRDIRLESLKRVEEKVQEVGQKSIKYILIGDKYVAFENIDQFLFTGLSKSAEFSGRRICIAKMIV
jgi:hypothetical protein